MKKSKLLVLSLLAVSAMSLASCTSEQGPKGDKGETGAPGEKGETGTPGKDGVDGKDGTNFLNGEGVPSSTLGKDGDSYLDTLTYDYYVKVSGAWVKKGNIKGEKGEDGEKGPQGDAGEKGEKGDTGSRGDTGPKGNDGDTAYSNIILQTEGLSVVPDKGSYTTTQSPIFYVTVTATEGIEDLTISLTNGSTVLKPVLTPVNGKENVYQCTAKMMDGGFIVKADFKTFTQAVSDGDENILLVGDVKLVENTNDVKIKSKTRIDFNGHYIDVNGNTINDLSDLTLVNSGKSSEAGEIRDTKAGTTNLLSVGGTTVEADTVAEGESSIKNDFSAISAFGLDNNFERYVDEETKTSKASLTVGERVSIVATGLGAAIATTGTDSHVTIQENATVKNTNSTENSSAKAIEVGGVGEIKIAGTVSSNKGTAIAVTETAKSDKEAASVTIEEKGSVASTSGTAVEVKAGEVKVEEKASVTGGTSAIKVENGSVKVSGTVTGGSESAVEVSGGSVTVENSGTVAPKTTTEETGGTKVVTADVIKVTGSDAIVDVSGKVEGGTSSAITVEKGSVTVSGTVAAKDKTETEGTAASAIKVTGGDVTISGSVSGSDKVVEVSNGSVKVEGTKAEVKASNGTAVSTSGDASLTVSSGTVSGTTSAVEVKGGSVTVDGGTVQVDTKEGATETDKKATSAIKIDGNASEGTKVELNGGTIENKNTGGSAISGNESGNVDINVKQDESGKSSVEIKEEGKTTTEDSGYKVSEYITVKTSVGDTAATLTPNKEKALILGENIIYTITPSDADKYVLSNLTVKVGDVEKSYLAKVKDGKVAIPLVTGTEVTATFKEPADTDFVFYSGSSKKVYTSFEGAIKAGETEIKLDKDLTVSNDLELSSKNLTIDLNGHNIDFATGKSIKVSNGSNFELKGKGIVNGKFETNDGSNHFFLVVENSSNSNKNVITIGKEVEVNVTNKEDQYVSFIKVAPGTNSQKTLSEVNFYGKVTVSNGFVATVNGSIAGENYSVEDNVVNVYEGANLITKGEQVLYQAGVSTFNVYGGTLQGGTGLEVRAGETNIKGGKFIADKTEFKSDPNSSGSTTCGAALAVVQHTTAKDINVTVDGGEFEGYKGLFAADTQKSSPTLVHIKLNGGTFTGSDTDIDVRDGIDCTLSDTVKHGDKLNGVNGKAYVETADELVAALKDENVKIINFKNKDELTIPASLCTDTSNGSFEVNGNKVINGNGKSIIIQGILEVNSPEIEFNDIVITSDYATKIFNLMGTCTKATFNNSKIINNKESVNARAIQIDELKASGKMILNLNNSELKVPKNGWAIYSFRLSEINLKGTTIGGYTSIYFWNDYEKDEYEYDPCGSIVNAENCVFNAENHYSGEDNNINVFLFDGETRSTMDCVVTLTNCKVNAKTVGTNTSITRLVGTNIDGKGSPANLKLTVKGSNSVIDCPRELVKEVGPSTENANVVIFEEGTYYKDPSKYVPEGSVITKTTDENGVECWVVSKKAQ